MPADRLTHSADVAIVGGGLAGGAAAALLAEAGVSVVLVEAARLPKDKLCGEFLSPEVIRSFRRLGILSAVRVAGAVPIHRTRITAAGGPTVYDDDLPAPGFGLSRFILDGLLLDRARQLGAHVYEACAATDLVGSLADGFTVTVEPRAGADADAPRAIRARVVLVAHGKRGTLDRTLNRPFFKRKDGLVGIKAHFTGMPVVGQVELHAFAGGYCGLSEIEGGRANLCLLATQAAFDARGGRPDAFVRSIARENAHLGERLAGAEKVTDGWIAISQISFSRKAQAARGALMLGDAAGLINPLTGNGQAMALRSAELAADGVLAYLSGRQSAVDLVAGYGASWRAEFRTRLNLGKLIQSVMLRPALLRPALGAIRLAPTVGRTLVALTREPADARA